MYRDGHDDHHAVHDTIGIIKGHVDKSFTTSSETLIITVARPRRINSEGNSATCAIGESGEVSCPT